MWFVCGSVLGRIRTLFRPKEAEADSLRQQIAKREAALLPLYVQVG